MLRKRSASMGPRFLNRGNKDRKSTRLNSSHSQISYAVFCLKKKKTQAHLLIQPCARLRHVYFHTTSFVSLFDVMYHFASSRIAVAGHYPSHAVSLVIWRDCA